MGGSNERIEGYRRVSEHELQRPKVVSALARRHCYCSSTGDLWSDRSSFRIFRTERELCNRCKLRSDCARRSTVGVSTSRRWSSAGRVAGWPSGAAHISPVRAEPLQPDLIRWGLPADRACNGAPASLSGTFAATAACGCAAHGEADKTCRTTAEDRCIRIG